MNHLETQYIRFPTITKLFYDGDGKSKPKDIFRTTRAKLTTNRQFYTNPSSHDQFKVINLPSQHQIINICTMSLPKREDKNEYEEMSQDKIRKKQFLKAKKSSTSLTGINFSIKRKASHTRFLFGGSNGLQKKINFNEMYSQVNTLIGLFHGVAITKPLINRVRRARVEKGNNGFLVKQTIKKRNWWNTTTDESIGVSLIWAQHLHKKNIPKEDCFVELDEEENVIFQRNFENCLRQNEKMLQLFFTQWEDIPMKLGPWISKMKAKVKIRAENLLILNLIPNHSQITNKKMLHSNLREYYGSKLIDPYSYIPTTYHITSYNWQYMVKQIRQEQDTRGKNKAWLLKPGQFSNQGKGITVFKNTKQALDYLLRHPPKGEERSMILQAYIKPLLYQGRKFDIRCFVLGVQILDSICFYWYDQGYIRTASEKFTLKNTSKSIHLTNDAVQKGVQNYDKYESANKLSYSEMEKYFHNNIGFEFYKKVVPEMKKIARDTCEAANKMGGATNSVYFELFGLDFIVNEKGKPFLLEVNTNPSLEISSNLMSRIIPEVLENSFRLVIDVLLPSHKGVPEWSEHFINNNKYSLLYRRKVVSKEKIGQKQQKQQN